MWTAPWAVVVALVLLVDLLVLANATGLQVDVEGGGESDDGLAHPIVLQHGSEIAGLLHLAGLDLRGHVLVLADELADDELDGLLLGAIATLDEPLAHRKVVLERAVEVANELLIGLRAIMTSVGRERNEVTNGRIEVLRMLVVNPETERMREAPKVVLRHDDGTVDVGGQEGFPLILFRHGRREPQMLYGGLGHVGILPIVQENHPTGVSVLQIKPLEVIPHDFSRIN